MIILTYNLYGLRIVHRMENGAKRLSKFMNKIKADILCFQETYKYIPLEIKSKYPYGASYWLCGLNILSKFPITEIKKINVGDNKGCLYCNISGYNIFNIHLDHISEIIRSQQIDTILEFIDNIVRGNNLPVILCGDFNSLNRSDYSHKKWNFMLENEKQYTPKNPVVYKKITERFYDSRMDRRKNPSTSVHNRRVDYIFTDFILKSGSEIIDNDEFSDHSPVKLIF